MSELRRRAPESRVIVLTSFLDDERLMAAVQAGACGYLLKDAEPAELARAIRTAHAGEAVIAPAAAGRLLRALSERETVRPAAEPDRLTRREQEVLELLARGYANKRIARELGIAEKTVKAHIGRVLAKLGVADRTQAALLAVREGLVPRS
jgi:DNA-binding NarL/FixJ family response regulator